MDATKTSSVSLIGLKLHVNIALVYGSIRFKPYRCELFHVLYVHR